MCPWAAWTQREGLHRGACLSGVYTAPLNRGVSPASLCVSPTQPKHNKQQKAHEYTRALNAAKLERIFAKPFIAALTHSDGITCLARNPKALNSLLSGTADGGIRIWDIPAQRTLRRLEGHTGAVKGISFAPDGETCVSCSTDCTVSRVEQQEQLLSCTCLEVAMALLGAGSTRARKAERADVGGGAATTGHTTHQHWQGLLCDGSSNI